MNEVMQRLMMPLVLGLATVGGEARAAEALPAQAGAAPQAAVVKIVERPSVATLRARHLPQLAHISSSDKFDRISQWFHKLSAADLEDLSSPRSHDASKELFIKYGYPDVVNHETTDALSKFFRESQSQVIIKQLQQLPANDFKHLQDLAKRSLETNSPETRRDLIKAFRDAGITVDPSALPHFYILLCAIGAVTILGASATAILNSTHLSIRGKKKLTNTKLPVVGTGDEKTAEAKSGDKSKRENRPERSARVAPEPKLPPGPSPEEIRRMADDWYARQKRKGTG